MFGLAFSAGSVVLEAVLLRGSIQLGRDLQLIEQRLQAVGYLVAFVGGLLLLEFWTGESLLRLGRRLELCLRMRFLEKIPRLPDRYFESRPRSDMAERCHSMHQLRLWPRLAGQFIRSAVALSITAAAICVIDPPSAPLAALAAVLAVALPIAFVSLQKGLDLRVRTHAGALGRFYLDALLGLSPMRAHGAERAVAREHEGLLVEWVQASRRVLRWVIVSEGLQAAVGFGLSGWLLLLHANRTTEAGGVLLLAYWALNLPTLGGELALLSRQYPTLRNITLRLLEPLGALEENVGTARAAGRSTPVQVAEATGVAINFKSVSVCAAGQTILQDIDLDIKAGSHVGIVGLSGAGKSSLVGLLLGWHAPATGQILVDGQPLDAGLLDRLRAETAWVDPAVQLWNRSLADNLLYGTLDGEAGRVGESMHEADLYDVLQRLPEGLQTSLGEGGGMVSGGEGQRVRLGRAMVRAQARLVILDEPFRGLDREKRRELLGRVRRLWRNATLLCVTHDVGETLDFSRVLVVETGRVVEDGPPVRLAANSTSRYRALLDAEEAVRTGLWSSSIWKHVTLETGQLAEDLSWNET
jgi:ATP-binding cassette subfamily B protein